MNDRIIPSIALLIALGIFFVYVDPTWSGAIADTKSAIALDDEALAAAQLYTEQQNSLATSRNAIDPAYLTRLSTFLPDSVDNVGLILDLNALAARSGLSLSNVDVVSNATGVAKASVNQGLLAAGMSPVGSIDLTLSAIGTYPALQAFLVGVERSARLLDIRDIVVKGSDTGVYNYQMALRLYWLR